MKSSTRWTSSLSRLTSLSTPRRIRLKPSQQLVSSGESLVYHVLKFKERKNRIEKARKLNITFVLKLKCLETAADIFSSFLETAAC